MSHHYAWCTDHVGDSGCDFCLAPDTAVGDVRVSISSGGANDVPAVEVYGHDAWFSANEARRLARALMEAADTLESSPLPDVRHADV